MDSLVITHVEEGIYKLQINDVAHQNRLSNLLAEELFAAFDELATKPDLKVLLLTGQREVFCAGGAEGLLQELSVGKSASKVLLLPHKILSFPLPIIGVLEGHAVGGGLTLALCCDLVVAAETGRYGMNFTEMGFTPGAGTTALLPAVVGHHFASEMIMTTKLYKGRELQGRSLFNYIVEADRVMTVALELAGRMAAKPRYVLELLKETLALPRRQAMQAAMSREHLMHKLCFSQPETAVLIRENYLG
ncbi:MAG: polyketide synthase [Caldilineaceae bacterium]